jgi:tripartite-type tricarboxylate transporter receptor subunit TctC
MCLIAARLLPCRTSWAACNYISTSLPQIEASAVKPIALLASRRSPPLPDLATAHEQGLKDFDADVWTAFFLPKETPLTIVQRLARATSDVLDTPAGRQRFADLGLRVARARISCQACPG